MKTIRLADERVVGEIEWYEWIVPESAKVVMAGHQFFLPCDYHSPEDFNVYRRDDAWPGE